MESKEDGYQITNLSSGSGTNELCNSFLGSAFWRWLKDLVVVSRPCKSAGFRLFRRWWSLLVVFAVVAMSRSEKLGRDVFPRGYFSGMTI